MENIKWKTVEIESLPQYPDGAIIIKEDTEIEYPLAVVPFPLGGHANGTKRQRERARLIAAAPELLNLLKRFVNVSGTFNDKQFGEKFPDAALTYVDAKELINSFNSMSLLDFGRTCRVCGCTDTNACQHPKVRNCWWVEKDLCSHCAITEIRDSGKVVRNKPLDLKFKVGDKVEIIPDDKYLKKIKRFYGKSLLISRIVFDKDGTPLYKCKGVPGYALESGLKTSHV